MKSGKISQVKGIIIIGQNKPLICLPKVCYNKLTAIIRTA